MDTSTHPLSFIFDHAPATMDGVKVFDSWMGSGKTRSTLKHYANTLHNTERPVVIAFREVRLAVEAAVMFNDFVAEAIEAGRHSKSARSNLCKYVSHVFNVLDKHMDYFCDAAELATDKKDGLAKKCVHWCGNAKASANLYEARLNKKIIFTTHASLVRMGAAGYLKGRDVIIDESPLGFVEVWRKVADPASLDAYHAIVAEQEDEDHPVHFYRAKAIMEGAKTTLAIDRGDGSHAVFYYPDMDTWKAHTITCMSGLAVGTDISVLEAIRVWVGKTPFEWIANRANFVLQQACVHRLVLQRHASIASVSSTYHAKASYKEDTAGFLKDAMKHKKTAYWGGHKKHQPQGLVAAKINETGMNSLQDRTRVYVDGLSYLTPDLHKIYSILFGPLFDYFNSGRKSGTLMQTLYRSSLRNSRSTSDVTVALYDYRVEEVILAAFPVTLQPSIRIHQFTAL